MIRRLLLSVTLLATLAGPTLAMADCGWVLWYLWNSEDYKKHDGPQGAWDFESGYSTESACRAELQKHL
jgi:hypothetical protein